MIIKLNSRMNQSNVIEAVNYGIKFSLEHICRGQRLAQEQVKNGS
jgi:hypothetical protein